MYAHTSSEPARTDPESFSREPSASATAAPATPEVPSPDSAAPKAGRDASGKFTVGNHGGPGNPHARQVAALRKHHLACATPEDVAAVYKAILDAAVGGSVPAQRLYFELLFGKNLKALDPDRIDAHEFEINKETAVSDPEMTALVSSPDPQTALRVTRIMRPITGSIIASKLTDMLRHPEKLMPKVEDISILDRPAPIPNGPIGDKLRDMLGKGKSGLPSANGPIGPDETARSSVL